MLTLIAEEIMSIGLALIDYKLVSMLTLIAGKIVPIGLVLIDYKLCLYSVLTLIADEIVSGFIKGSLWTFGKNLLAFFNPKCLENVAFLCLHAFFTFVFPAFEYLYTSTSTRQLIIVKNTHVRRSTTSTYRFSYLQF